MKRTLLLTSTFAVVTSAAYAGGYLTNTNQNAAFGRNLSQEARIDITSTYANPAGVGFLAPGWHFSFNNQSAFQTRTIDSSYGDNLFGVGTVNGVHNGNGTKRFKGTAKAPILPSFDLAYVRDRWSVALHFGITGGGGKCTFDDGLGSFESQVALLPVLSEVLRPGAVSGYQMDTYLKGRQYYFGTQLNATYRVLPDVSVALGLRMVNASCAYDGYVKNIAVVTPQGTMPAADFLTAAGMGSMAALVGDRVLDNTQSGMGFTPIIGVDWRINDHWNVAAKYEFKTRLRLKNSTESVTDANGNTTELNAGLEAYSDGVSQKADIPAILYVGAQYSPVERVRINVGGHIYFDKQATQHNERHHRLDGQGWELLAGAEYDVNSVLTVSAGWQNTNYGLGKNSEFITDMSFVTNSNSVGLGARVHVSKKVALDVSYFKTFYSHYHRTQADYNGNWATMSAKLAGGVAQLQGAVGQLNAGIEQLNAALTNTELPAAQAEQLGMELQRYTAQRDGYQAQLLSLGQMAQAAGATVPQKVYGSDNFTRTNDVFGIGVVVSF